MYKLILKNSKISIVTSILLSICSIYSLVKLFIIENVIEFITNYFDNLLFSDAFIETLDTLNISFADVALFFYIYMLITAIMLLLLSIALFVLSVHVENCFDFSIEKLNKRKPLYIVYLILIIATLLFTSNFEIPSTGLIISSLYIVSIILLIISLVGAIKILISISNEYKKSKVEPELQTTPSEKQPDFDSSIHSGNQIGEENLDKPIIINNNQEKLDEMYLLLSKLEKQFKNGEISNDDYQRMKETILNTYFK